ncbi:hypothetical protein Tco_0084561 [Tanacetum coccineum]
MLIYSKSKKEHKEHLRQILNLLKKEELYDKFSKCEFWISRVQFLSHVIDCRGIHVDPAKIESIKDWAVSLITPRKIRQFLGPCRLIIEDSLKGFKDHQDNDQTNPERCKLIGAITKAAYFNCLKQKLCSAPIWPDLRESEESSHTQLQRRFLGDVLMSKSKGDFFAPRQLKIHEKNWKANVDMLDASEQEGTEPLRERVLSENAIG